MLGKKLPECRVHRRGVAEDLGYVGSKEHQIRVFPVAGVVLSPYAFRSRGLLGDFEIAIVILIHRVFDWLRRSFSGSHSYFTDSQSTSAG